GGSSGTTGAASAGPPQPTASVENGLPSSLAKDFAGIRQCESSDVYSLDTGNGYYGAYQFSAATWTGLGGSGLASQASPAAQDAGALRLYQQGGWSSWPACAAILGLP
ncbi:MAG: Transglycosylase-like domain protein, partial [Acidimicrobiaceae bacterium]|nr:Transglycosylase-like domain protein [Acidimicrobiaceae bacterium]